MSVPHNFIRWMGPWRLVDVLETDGWKRSHYWQWCRSYLEALPIAVSAQVSVHRGPVVQGGAPSVNR